MRHKRRKNQHLALALAALITPATVMASVLALWRLAADLKFTSAFPITDGLFSHWQTWLVATFVLQGGAILLNRYGKTEIVFRNTVEAPEQKLVDTGR
ncbi:MAG: hypothetical protein LAP38_06055 [Acidobacteriia bacterium]|nr:hypothetical protein [Terriglobia bacterium]